MKPMLFRIKNKSQRILLTLAGVDDSGIKFQSPMGVPINDLLLGEVLIDVEENQYQVKGIGIQYDVVWVENLSNKKESAA